MPDILILWRDRRGRLSPLRIVTLAVLLWPAALIAIDAARGALGGRPLNEVIHRTGWWALVFLLASLLVTPLRSSARFVQLFDVRRMIGVACALYAGTHLLLYVADQGFDLVRVATEIASRLYLTIGFVALLGLLALGITSNDAMVKRLGGLRWRRLHRLTYGITLLALIHYFQQTKADVSVPTMYAAFFGWLVGYRLLAAWRAEKGVGPVALVGLALVVSCLTFLAEGVGIGLSFGQPLAEFLPLYADTLTDFSLGVRPGWWVLAAGLAVAALSAVRAAMASRRPAAPARPAPARPAAARTG